MSFFEYWHNIKLSMQPKNAHLNAIASAHGEEGGHDTSLLQFHTLEELEAGILGIYGTSSIKAARKLLVKLGVLLEQSNPSDRYKFDRTIYYLFKPENYEEWLQSRVGEITYSSGENTRWSGKNDCSIQRLLTEKEEKDKREGNASIPTHSQACSESIETIENKKQKEPIKIMAADSAKTAKKASASRFIAPTHAEVAAYCSERSNAINAAQFIDYYAARGWKIGNSSMKDWKAAVRTWEGRANGYGQNQRAASFADANKSTGWIDAFEKNKREEQELGF